MTPRFELLIVLPSCRPQLASAQGLAGVLARSLIARACATCTKLGVEPRVSLLGFDALTGAVMEAPAAWYAGESVPWRHSPLADFLRRLQEEPDPPIRVFSTATHVLRGQPGLPRVVVAAAKQGFGGAEGGSEGALAFAMRGSEVAGAVEPVARLLRALCVRSPAGAGLPPLPGGANWVVSPLPGPTMSPTMRGYPSRLPFAGADAPAYVNAALAEALEHPASDAPLDGDPHQLREALVAQRETSAVRWIYNELLNIVEYHLAHPQPESVPPEVHVAISGRCNIECKFCSYDHKTAGREPVTLQRLMRFESLRDVRILRLHSGNGEPTLNRDLPALIDYVSRAHPHVGMNFFTNGILLEKPALAEALVGGHVQWISVSVNAASAQQWQRLCGVDQFDRVLKGLERLQAAKRERGSLTPVVHGSMVLTRESVWELRRMPELCRRLGIDRFTAIPFFSLGYERNDRFGPNDAYHHIGTAYDTLYKLAVDEARRHEVSIELPPPLSEKVAAFGVETRHFHDFAHVERSTEAIPLLLSSWTWTQREPCHFLWKQAAIGIAMRAQSPHPGGNFLYPCLGPLATVNFAPRTHVAFGDHEDFMATWRNPVFTRLREGQSKPGTVPVCDTCRGCDTRAPSQMRPMQAMLADFVHEHGLG